MPTPSKRTWAAGASAVAVAGFATWVLWPSAEASPYPERPEGVYIAADTREFTDLSTMTASSALVVEGTVTAVGPGDSIEFEDGSETVQTNREVTISVEAILHNRYAVEDPKTVVMVEGYWESGVGYAREGLPWVEVGDSGYFYLTAPPPEHRDEEIYSLVHQYGRILLENDQTVSIPGHWEEEGPWSTLKLDATDAVAFEAQILDAADAASSGEVEPALVTVCEPLDPDDEDSEPICWEQ